MEDTFETLIQETLTEVSNNKSTYPEFYALMSLPPEQLQQLGGFLQNMGNTPDINEIRALAQELNVDIEGFAKEFKTLDDKFDILTAAEKEKDRTWAKEEFAQPYDNYLDGQNVNNNFDSPVPLAENNAGFQSSGEDPYYRDETPDGEPHATGTVEEAIKEAELTSFVQDPYYKIDHTEIYTLLDELEKEAEIADKAREDLETSPVHWTVAGLENKATGEIITATPAGATTSLRGKASPENLKDDGESFIVTPPILSGLDTVRLSDVVSTDTEHGLPAEAVCETDNPLDVCPTR